MAHTTPATPHEVPTDHQSEAVGQYRGWNPILAIAIVLVLFLVPQILAATFVASLAHGGGGLMADEVFKQFLFVLFAEALTLLGLYGVLRTRQQTFRSLGLIKPRLSDSVYVVVGFIAYFMLNVILVTVVSKLVPGLNVDQKQDLGFNTAAGLNSLIPVFIALVVLAPITEEILVRGFLFGSLRKYMPMFWALLTTSVIFGSAHLFGGESGAPLLWIAAIDTFALSVVLCYLREKTGGLWAGIGLHALKNLVAFIALFILHVSA